MTNETPQHLIRPDLAIGVELDTIILRDAQRLQAIHVIRHRDRAVTVSFVEMQQVIPRGAARGAATCRRPCATLLHCGSSENSAGPRVRRRWDWRAAAARDLHWWRKPRGRSAAPAARQQTAASRRSHRAPRSESPLRRRCAVCTAVIGAMYRLHPPGIVFHCGWP